MQLNEGLNNNKKAKNKQKIYIKKRLKRGFFVVYQDLTFDSVSTRIEKREKNIEHLKEMPW